MICPKCHDWQQSHPSYTKDKFGREWLEERCFRCGYSEKRACADAENNDSTDRSAE